MIKTILSPGGIKQAHQGDNRIHVLCSQKQVPVHVIGAISRTSNCAKNMSIVTNQENSTVERLFTYETAKETVISNELNYLYTKKIYLKRNTFYAYETNSLLSFLCPFDNLIPHKYTLDRDKHSKRPFHSENSRISHEILEFRHYSLLVSIQHAIEIGSLFLLNLKYRNIPHFIISIFKHLICM